MKKFIYLLIDDNNTSEREYVRLEQVWSNVDYDKLIRIGTYSDSKDTYHLFKEKK